MTETAPDAVARPAVPWHRLLVLLVLCLAISVGPFVRQGMGWKRGPKVRYLRHWVMYKGAALDVCRVKYSQIGADGRRVPLNRYELLGYEDRWAAPRSVRTIRSAPAARRLGKRMCGLLGPDADVRVVGDCATQDGWELRMNGRGNLCVIDAVLK